MTQSEKVNTILVSLNLLTPELIQSLSNEDLKNLRASIGCKEILVSRIYKQRIHSKTHFKPENKKAD